MEDQIPGEPQVTTIKQESNARLLVWTESPRGPDYGPHLWKRAGRILIIERLRTNTHRLVAVRFEADILGNTWWAFKPDSLSTEQEKVLSLWLNASLSVLLLFGRRVVTQGAWMQMKQPAWESMPVLDVRALGSNKLNALAEAYDNLCGENLEAIAGLAHDPTRRKIDEAIAGALGLPDLSPIRELLAREPGLTARDINPRATQMNLIEEEDEEDGQGRIVLN